MSDEPALAFDPHYLVGLSINWDTDCQVIRSMMAIVDGKVPTKEQVAEMEADFEEGIAARRGCPGSGCMAVWGDRE